MDNEFLHKISLELLKKETNLTLEEIASLSGITDAKNLGKWSQDKERGGSRPNFNALVKLLRKGATTKTLFGVEQEVVNNVEIPPHIEKILKNPEFIAGLEAAYNAEVVKK
jgi:transcriptional regulator with XRE-family HTH domain